MHNLFATPISVSMLTAEEPPTQIHFRNQKLRNHLENTMHFRAREAYGDVHHNLSQEERVLLWKTALLEIDMGIRPVVLQLLREMAAERGKPAGWAEAVAEKVKVKQMAQALDLVYQDRVFQEIESTKEAGKDFRNDLIKSSMSSAIHRTFDASMTAKRILRLEARVAALEVHAAQVDVIQDIHSGILAPSLLPWQQKAIAMARMGRPQRVIAAELGVSQKTIARLVSHDLTQN